MYELSTVIDSIPPKDLQTLKDIRLAAAIAKELQDSCKEYTEKVIAVNLKQQEVLKKYQAELKLEGLSKEEQEKIIAETNLKFQEEVGNKYGKEIMEANKFGEKECECELADDKFSKLKEIFEKYAVGFYTKKEALLIVAEALEL